MSRFLENVVAAMVVVGVLAALGFLALKAAFGGLDGSDYFTAPAVGVGAAIGYRISRRRADAKRGRT